MLSSAGISFFGGACLTGSTPCMKYAYSACTSSSLIFAYDTYGIAGYRLSPFFDTPWRTARSKSSADQLPMPVSGSGVMLLV